MVANLGQQNLEQICLRLGLGEFRQDFVSNSGCQFFHQPVQRAFDPNMVINAVVQTAHDLHNTVLKSRKGFKTQIIDRRLQKLHLFAPGLGGLHIFNKDVAVGNDVRIRHLPGNVHARHSLKIGPCKQADEKQGEHKYRKPQTTMVAGPQHAKECEDASWTCRFFLHYHRRLRLLPPRGAALRRPW